jgi:general secretion pathway protein G
MKIKAAFAHYRPAILLGSSKSRRGFTLIELVLVLTIIAVLMGAAIFTMNKGGFFQGAADTRINSDINTAISLGLENYFIAAGRYPTTEQGLDALVEKPTKPPIPDRWNPSLDEIPLDPWKQPYKYKFPARPGSKKAYDIWSIGKDGQDGTEDDIGNWPAATK